MSNHVTSEEVKALGEAAVPAHLAVSAPRDTDGPRWRLDYLPVSLFGSVMGLSGLSIAWHLAHVNYGAPNCVAISIGIIAIIAFLLMTLGYGFKLVTSWDSAKSEFHHPIAGNLFGTLLISWLLLPIILAPMSLLLAQAMWVVGAAGMVLFAVLVVNRWMGDRQQTAHATPSWIVPVVGLLDVPLAVPSLGLPPMQGVMVLGLAVGLFFAIPLFTLVFARLIFESPMPEALSPTLMILVAPFAVGFSTYVATTGEVDLFAQSLFALTLFMLAVIATKLRHFPRCCPFRVSWWAVSFPIAASAVSALKFAAARPSWLTHGIAWALLDAATIIIGGLLLRTVLGVLRGELRKLSS